MRTGFLLILILLTGGCIRSVDELSVDALPIDRVTKPNVICFISPQDTVLTAKIAMSEPQIVSSFAESLVVKDAVVLLSDSSRSIQLLYDDRLKYYRAVPQGRFTIRPGVTYRLTVSMSGDRSVTAEATVPQTVPIDRVSLDSTVARNSANAALTTYTTTVYWTSPGAGSGSRNANYYRGWAEIDQAIVDQSTGQSVSPRVSQPSFFVERETGQIGAQRLMTGTHTLLTGPNTGTRTRRIRAGLLTTDENYYRYHTSLREQFVNQEQNFAEPTVLYSNIVGGYGVFAAFNGSYTTVNEPVSKAPHQ
ncbi:DUF4249 domain-containing protein [Larkinella sp. VNQ87]|uniref:DUF4249 domain-containing protein n=1 Tax=Larkinella sp. VNQ87 TaxID=3400921 RepID=UPI003C0B829C